MVRPPSCGCNLMTGSKRCCQARTANDFCVEPESPSNFGSVPTLKNGCFGTGSGWIRVFSPIRIRVLKFRIRVLKFRIRPLINLWDLNDGFDNVLEEPDKKGQC